MIGNVNMDILWPPYDQIDSANENNNSVVLVLMLDSVSFVLCGDAEEGVWSQIASHIPGDTYFFKVPHHGSAKGTFDRNDKTPWYDFCPQNALLGISSHVRPFSHPDQEVIDLFESHSRKYYRTDEHYHITFMTDGQEVKVKYSHFD